MSRGISYTTKGRTLILEYLKSNINKTVSAQEIYDSLPKEEGINRSTVYRYLDKLVKDGVLLKSVAQKGECAMYQYIGTETNCFDHLHMKCTKCGHVYHLDCEFMNSLKGHVEKEHGFLLQCQNSTLYGICDRCRKHSS